MSKVYVVDGKEYRRHMNRDGSRGGLVPVDAFISGLGDVFIDSRVILRGAGLHIEGHLQFFPMRKNEVGEKREPKPETVTIRGVVYTRFLASTRPLVSGGLVATYAYIAPVAHVAAGLMVAGTGQVLGRYLSVERIDPAAIA